MEEHRARKRFGQHFLHDQGVIDRIVKAVDPRPGERLVEIGPGLGALTLPLLRAAGHLEAVELDRDVIPRLKEKCAGVGELIVHQGDALKFDLSRLSAGPASLRLVGNLPYNISTPLLFRFLDQATLIRDMHFMLQREVVDRMCATAGSRAYGRLSVMLAARCQVEPLFRIGRGAFSPPPKVESAVVRLVPCREPPFEYGDPALFAQVVRQAFSARRKTLRNALKGLASEADLRAAGIDPAARSETVPPERFGALSGHLGA
ncbi:MAG: 16S rRNA (adenine(1518)-N(6)/adenine(1519)-N(6))-dimethyltransferase RsmA [Gammaproteobacteria bacterium]|jgi:16S rRNA (adenine1518-N6/adenine1519-N6)-dimethyltransferase